MIVACSEQFAERFPPLYIMASQFTEPAPAFCLSEAMFTLSKRPALEASWHMQLGAAITASALRHRTCEQC